MKLSKKEANLVRGAVAEWKDRGLLDSAKSAELLADIAVQPFDWKRLAKYSLWVSLICIVSAVGSVLADRALMELIEAVFNAPHFVKCIAMSLAAAGLYAWGLKRRRRYPEKLFSNEGVLFLGVLATAAAIYQLGRAMDTGSGHFSLLLLLSFLVYGAIGLFFRSTLVWVFALASLGSWFGAETGYASGWGAYYLGMNFPMRFVLFGGALTGAAFALEKQPWFERFSRATLAMGLLYLFIALWILSIFGNYGDMGAWSQVKQIELFHWSLLFAIAAGGAIWHGLKTGDGMTKGFGITFLLINLYTRFFEHFWEATHKAIFFAILGASFWLISTKAERIWNLGGRSRA